VMTLTRAIGPANPSASSIHRLRHKDGHWIWVHSNYSFMSQVGPGEPNIMAVVRDDTERQSRELKLRHS
ncbi:PAS domain S-box protein, partial [Streptococcus pneumoniae]|uniref:PAS domain S-box protein n=1 Tax=Streptococcus pneumoniae TaxID=1313 RepID=UPI0013DB3055